MVDDRLAEQPVEAVEKFVDVLGGRLFSHRILHRLREALGEISLKERAARAPLVHQLDAVLGGGPTTQ